MPPSYRSVCLSLLAASSLSRYCRPPHGTTVAPPLTDPALTARVRGC